MFVRQCLDLGSNTPHPVAARLRGAGASVLAGLLALAFAQVASATPFTLAAPVIIDGSNDGGSGVRATIRQVFDLTGPLLVPTDPMVGVDPLDPTVDVFAFDITLDPGSAPIDELGISVVSTLFFINPVGVGAFDDTGSGDIAPTSVFLNTVGLQGVAFFGAPLTGGQTSVRLFVTHDPVGDLIAGQTVNFMISSGADFTVQGEIVPEPGTLTLVGAGLAMLGAAARRRRTRHG